MPRAAATTAATAPTKLRLPTEEAAAPVGVGVGEVTVSVSWLSSWSWSWSWSSVTLALLLTTWIAIPLVLHCSSVGSTASDEKVMSAHYGSLVSLCRLGLTNSTYVVKSTSRCTKVDDLQSSVLSLLNQTSWQGHLWNAESAVACGIVELWGQRDVEGCNLVAQAQVDGVVCPCVAEFETNRATIERPESAFSVFLRDIGAWKDPLVGSICKGITTPFWVAEGEVGECRAGEEGECEDVLHFESD